jgi:hypothetical protein
VLISEPPQTAWTCRYCGSANPLEALYCGQFGPEHCGAARRGASIYQQWWKSMRKPRILEVSKTGQTFTVTRPGMSARQFEQAMDEQWQARMKAAFYQDWEGS